MKLTKEQIDFLDKVCFNREWWVLNENDEVDVEGSVGMSNMNLTEIPVKFGAIKGHFNCVNNNLTTLKNCPTSVGYSFRFHKNNLTDYFKNIKEEDFKCWSMGLNWLEIIEEYPFLINIGKKYIDRNMLKYYLSHFPKTKLYLE